MIIGLVSVVVPVYNMAQYLGETLASILASTYSNIEVIVVNDGSTDGTAVVAGEYAKKDERVSVISQPNRGVCVARNAGVSRAKGEYILPVDADNRIAAGFIASALACFKQNPALKVVAPRAEFFGARTGEWKLPPFSLSLLARKNIMDTCALYRKEDWEKVGGYCEEIMAREDWEFWISVLKDGGEVCRLPEVSLYYRVREGSKRVTDRNLKRHVVDVLNKRHPEFFERELGGPLHYSRSWSRCANRIYRFFHPRKVRVGEKYKFCESFVNALPVLFRNGEGRIVYQGRNELREIDYKGYTFVVKSFCRPHIVNRVVYGLLRTSKAQRSYEYALSLLHDHIGTPEPVGYFTERNGLLFNKSYYVSLKSECVHVYSDFLYGKCRPTENVLRAIGRTTAKMHEAGYLHKDYSRGNILFVEADDGSVKVDIVDLNRIRLRPVDMETVCKNFERLPATRNMQRVMAEEYAKTRGFAVEGCVRLISEARDARHDEQKYFSNL